MYALSLLYFPLIVRAVVVHGKVKWNPIVCSNCKHISYDRVIAIEWWQNMQSSTLTTLWTVDCLTSRLKSWWPWNWRWHLQICNRNSPFYTLSMIRLNTDFSFGFHQTYRRAPLWMCWQTWRLQNRNKTSHHRIILWTTMSKYTWRTWSKYMRHM